MELAGQSLVNDAEALTSEDFHRLGAQVGVLLCKREIKHSKVASFSFSFFFLMNPVSSLYSNSLPQSFCYQS